MPPSPENAGPRQPAKHQADVVAGNDAAPGLCLPAWVTTPAWEVGVAAVMQDFTPGEVILLLDDPIAPGTQVAVQVDTSAFHGEILFCKPSGERWEAHVSFDDADEIGLRRTPRFPVRIPARVFATTSDAPMEGTIVDISGEGVGIELPQSVAVAASIVVQSEETMALGEVRHCRGLSSGLFRVGVLLHHIIKRDRELEKASAESSWINKLGARFGLKKTDRPKGWS
jgi:hypothetical protein